MGVLRIRALLRGVSLSFGSSHSVSTSVYMLHVHGKNLYVEMLDNLQQTEFRARKVSVSILVSVASRYGLSCKQRC